MDNNTTTVTLAVVDRHGELLAHTCLQKLVPPRRGPKAADDGPRLTEEEEMHRRKVQFSIAEEMKEHELDKDKVRKLIQKFEVDLIVVGANKLQARSVKLTLSQIAENLKNFNDQSKEGDEARQESTREAFVIWGSLEVPKLFSNSHLSQKLLKGADPILKQAVSLARFEQDPLAEILNLWSFVT